MFDTLEDAMKYIRVDKKSYVQGAIYEIELPDQNELNVASLTDEDAMRLSIAKWMTLLNIVSTVDRSTSEIGIDWVDTCPLCVKFYWGAPTCAGCPIRESDQKYYMCRETPISLIYDTIGDKDVPQEKITRLVRNEVRFLKRIALSKHLIPRGWLRI